MKMLDLYKEDLEKAEKELELYLKMHRFPKHGDVEYLKKQVEECRESYICCSLGC